ncbi:putative non-ribosomal peptide synthetase (plasmid) [Rhodococcus opacus B4]|uniref:Putative non-ribosomal peptide synthetase n=1 Tax=Rhodococcus opacus (strain B4) TaxID=632772 RepID=C1BCR4_RHOOB|nr:putative non-ribosomal peptide synthetase [Rhodococcus opacus B4]
MALRADERALTYVELDRRSSRVARALISRGTGPETLVAVADSRSIESVVGLWAVVKSGAAFVPIDPCHPADRITYTVADSGAAIGLAVSQARDRLPDSLKWLALDSEELCGDQRSGPVHDLERTHSLRRDHPAYVIYTSGSTGTPKVVRRHPRRTGEPRSRDSREIRYLHSVPSPAPRFTDVRHRPGRDTGRRQCRRHPGRGPRNRLRRSGTGQVPVGTPHHPSAGYPFLPGDRRPGRSRRVAIGAGRRRTVPAPAGPTLGPRP